MLAVSRIFLALCAVALAASAFPAEAFAQARASRTVPAKGAAAKSSAKKPAPAAADAEVSDLGEAEPENLPGENFSAAWPSVSRIADMLSARVARNGPDAWVYETQHFRFTANAPVALSAIREIARIFEGTYAANLALPINSPCNHHQVCEKGKFNAYLFETYDQYLAAGGMKGSAGVFIGYGSGLDRGKVLVPFPSLGLEKRGNRYFKGGRRVDAKTLSHEITHHMTIGGNAYPTWFCEGLAEYVGLSYDGNGQVRFGGNKNVIGKFVAGYGEKGDGGRGIGGRPEVGMSLENFMNHRGSFIGDGFGGAGTGADATQIGYGVSALLVYYFFHLDGKRDAARVKKFIAEIQSGGNAESATAALLDGRSWEQLEKEIRRKLKVAFKVEPRFAD